MRTDRPANIRLAAIANMVLGALALASILLANDRLTALWSAGFVGVGLLIWGGVDAWAASRGQLQGTKLLAMFMAILGIVLIGMAWMMDTSRLYQWAASIIGGLVVAVSIVDAIISPDEDRRNAFEPRRPDDMARPPTNP